MPKHIVSHKVVLNASSTEIYELLIDPQRISKFVPRVTQCEIISGPKKGLGTLSEWTWKDEKGNLSSWKEEIIEAIPNKRMSFRYHDYRNITGTHELKSVPEGTEITFTEIHDYPDIDPEQAQKDCASVIETLKRALK